MRLSKTARTTLVAATIFILPLRCFADDPDPPVAEAAIAEVPVQNLFMSWFGPRAAKLDPVEEEREIRGSEADRPATPGLGVRAGHLVVGALGLLGVAYRPGGSTPSSGFDCSGMVRYVFQNAIGLDLPRRAEEISRIGTSVTRNELRPGDLVFYNTLRRTFSHVGIYLGDNRFIHAPSAGGSVRVDDMSQGYWAARFNGARRVGS